MRHKSSQPLIALIWTFVFSCSNVTFAETGDDLRSLADSYMAATLARIQPWAYDVGLPLDSHDRFLDNTPEALVEFQGIEDTVIHSLHKIDPSELIDERQRIFYIKFKEYSEANKGIRVCHDELWQFDPVFNGAHLLIEQLIKNQPIKTQADKAQTLQRWRAIKHYYEQEVVNLNEGLKQGYTAPKRVVKRVIDQIERVVNADSDSHPYLKLADRSSDKAFQRAFKTVVKDDVLPALKTYVDYLQKVYLIKTRSELGVQANTDGRQCYIAKYRYYTTLQKTPEQVYRLGLETVNRQEQEVVDRGKKVYGVNTFEQVLTKTAEDEREQFDSADVLHEFYQQVVARARQTMPQAFYKMPTIDLIVEPIPEHLQGTGISPTYHSGDSNNPGKFIYDPSTYSDEKIGRAEILSVHEGFPGHHMQLALAIDQKPFHPVETLFNNNAFREGWARYAETLSEELGIYHSKSALIYRRAWPARGMVVDTALHTRDWSNEKIKAFMAKSGHITDLDQMIDRMATIPAQLTAYDSGALEIFSLRKRAKEKLGKCFDLKMFHYHVLKNGNVPLTELRAQVEAWIDEQTRDNF